MPITETVRGRGERQDVCLRPEQREGAVESLSRVEGQIPCFYSL